MPSGLRDSLVHLPSRMVENREVVVFMEIIPMMLPQIKVPLAHNVLKAYVISVDLKMHPI